MIETVVAPNPGAFTLDGTHSYVIDGRVVVDPGPAITSHIDALVAKLSDPLAIFITHRHGDHAPAAEELRRIVGVPVYAPPQCLETVDVPLMGDRSFELGSVGLRAIPTPGHTSEHFCFLTPDGDLFTGDTVLGEGTTVIFPPDGDMNDYIATLEKLIALAPRAIYPGHGPVRHDAGSLLRHYLDHRLGRESEVRVALATGAQTIPELRAKIYPVLDPRLVRAAELQLLAHLQRLIVRDEVEREGDYYRLR
jgi:glyoxylase-like metal-dependent hydrolase (beta-lactamase superfamily II)